MSGSPIEEKADPVWWSYAADLAVRLVAEGTITEHAWRKAFAATPRHLLTRLNHPIAAGTEAPAWWWECVYAESTTALTPSGALPLAVVAQPFPSHVAWLLGLVTAGRTDTRPDGRPVRVLDVDAEHGYVTALLCHRFGAKNVTAMEALRANTTREALAVAGWRPMVLDAHNVRDAGAYGPFDLILSTRGGRDVVNLAWFRQLAPGGRIVTAVHDSAGRLSAYVRECPAEGRRTCRTVHYDGHGPIVAGPRGGGR